MIKLEMAREMIGSEEMWVINTIECGEVIASESFDKFEDCAREIIEQKLSMGATDAEIKWTILGMTNIDKEDRYARVILDLLKEHYEALEEMGE